MEGGKKGEEKSREGGEKSRQGGGRKSVRERESGRGRKKEIEWGGR